MEPCIYRGPNRLFIPLPQTNAYHCYNKTLPHQKCVDVASGYKRDKVSSLGYNLCETCTVRVDKLEQRKREIAEGELRFITTEMLMAETFHLASQIPADCAGIVGVARSGMIPATALAAYVNLPLFEFAPDVASGRFQIREVSSGTRGKKVLRKNGPLFVVDDTIHSGSMAKIIRTCFPSGTLYAVVYALPESINLVDVYQSKLPSPHLLEWNLFNTPIICGADIDERLSGGLAFDFDGILCYDPPPGIDYDNGDLGWLVKAKPTAYLPRAFKIPLIVTMRLESWRGASVEWLNRYHVPWERMEMCQLKTAAERDKDHLQAVLNHKVQKFGESKCSLFVESDPSQAALIHQCTGKPVLCPAERKIHQKTKTP